MRIGNNISAMNTLNRLSVNNSSLSKSLEKLSSGSAINRAADDAAGLAISEKMRAQIAGLEQASKNAQDGISLVQTAEGALDQTHTALRRMETLAMKAKNGTITAEDRAKIQAEVDARTNEIDRVAATSNFNGIKLFDGSLSGVKGAGDAIAADTSATENTISHSGISIYGGTAGVKVNMGTDISLDDGEVTATWNNDTLTINMGITAAATGNVTIDQKAIQKAIDAAAGSAPDGNKNLTIKIAANGSGANAITINDDGAADNVSTANLAQFTLKDYVASSYTKTTSTGKTVSFSTNAGELVTGFNGAIDVTAPDNSPSVTFSTAGVAIALDNTKDSYTADEINALISKGTGKDTTPISDGFKVSFEGSLTRAELVAAFSGAEALAGGSGVYATGGGGLDLQIGATSDDADKITVQVSKMDAASLLGVAHLDMSTPDAAKIAIDNINAAIEKVSVQRANLGAVQNRLEQTIENLSTTAENMSAAESRIRDVDMAKQMTEFTKYSILSQASQAMLAQANSLPQGVLQLLK